MHLSVRKSIVWAVLVSFLISDVSLADTAVLKKDFPVEFRERVETLRRKPEGLLVSSSAASVTDAFKGASEKLVIHIQDAHTNLGAQKNLAKVLDEIIQQYGVDLVFVEGGTGNDSLSFLRRYATPEVRRRIAMRFLEKGEISGEEYLDIVSEKPFILWGIEDPSLYEKSLVTYARVIEIRKAALAYLDRLARAVEAVKPRVYSPEFFDFEKAAVDFRKTRLSFTDYFERLRAESGKNGIDFAGLDSLARLEGVRELESRIDFRKADAQQAEIVRKLSKSEPLFASLVQAADRLKLGRAPVQAFYDSLEARMGEAKMPLELYPDFEAYLRYLKGFAAIDIRKLLEDIESVENGVFARYAGDPDSIRLREITRYVDLLRNYFSLKLKPSEFQTYKKNLKDFRITSWLAYLNRKLIELGRHAEAVPLDDVLDDRQGQVEAFYRTVEARDHAFVDRAFDKMEESKRPVAVLICGGYHTPHLKELMREKDASYVVVTPFVTEETDMQNYERVLLGSLDPTKRWMVSAREGTVRPLRAFEKVDTVPAIQGQLFRNDGLYGKTVAQAMEFLGSVRGATPERFGFLAAALDSGEIEVTLANGQRLGLAPSAASKTKFARDLAPVKPLVQPAIAGSRLAVPAQKGLLEYLEKLTDASDELAPAINVLKKYAAASVEIDAAEIIPLLEVAFKQVSQKAKSVPSLKAVAKKIQTRQLLVLAYSQTVDMEGVLGSVFKVAQPELEGSLRYLQEFRNVAVEGLETGKEIYHWQLNTPIKRAWQAFEQIKYDGWLQREDARMSAINEVTENLLNFAVFYLDPDELENPLDPPSMRWDVATALSDALEALQDLKGADLASLDNGVKNLEKVLRENLHAVWFRRLRDFKSNFDEQGVGNFVAFLRDGRSSLQLQSYHPADGALQVINDSVAKIEKIAVSAAAGTRLPEAFRGKVRLLELTVGERAAAASSDAVRSDLALASRYLSEALEPQNNDVLEAAPRILLAEARIARATELQPVGGVRELAAELSDAASGRIPNDALSAVLLDLAGLSRTLQDAGPAVPVQILVEPREKEYASYPELLQEFSERLARYPYSVVFPQSEAQTGPEDFEHYIDRPLRRILDRINPDSRGVIERHLQELKEQVSSPQWNLISADRSIRIALDGAESPDAAKRLEEALQSLSLNAVGILSEVEKSLSATDQIRVPVIAARKSLAALPPAVTGSRFANLIGEARSDPSPAAPVFSGVEAPGWEEARERLLPDMTVLAPKDGAYVVELKDRTALIEVTTAEDGTATGLLFDAASETAELLAEPARLNRKEAAERRKNIQDSQVRLRTMTLASKSPAAEKAAAAQKILMGARIGRTDYQSRSGMVSEALKPARIDTRQPVLVKIPGGAMAPLLAVNNGRYFDGFMKLFIGEAIRARRQTYGINVYYGLDTDDPAVKERLGLLLRELKAENAADADYVREIALLESEINDGFVPDKAKIVEIFDATAGAAGKSNIRIPLDLKMAEFKEGEGEVGMPLFGAIIQVGIYAARTDMSIAVPDALVNAYQTLMGRTISMNDRGALKDVLTGIETAIEVIANFAIPPTVRIDIEAIFELFNIMMRQLAKSA